MKRLILVIGFVSVSALLASAGFGFDLSSDMVMTAKGQVHKSKIYMKEQKFRIEAEGQAGYNIVRADKDLMWVVMTGQKSYMEMRYDPSKAPKTQEKLRGEVSRKLIGYEKVDGRPTEKYDVTYTESGKTDRMYQWIATDIKFPVKMASVDGSWTMEYRNINMGSQPDSLFELPAGYQKVGMPGLKDALGERGHEEPDQAADQEPKQAADQESQDAQPKESGGFWKKLPKINLPGLPR
jgi:hypothetical protein